MPVAIPRSESYRRMETHITPGALARMCCLLLDSSPVDQGQKRTLRPRVAFLFVWGLARGASICLFLGGIRLCHHKPCDQFLFLGLFLCPCIIMALFRCCIRSLALLRLELWAIGVRRVVISCPGLTTGTGLLGDSTRITEMKRRKGETPGTRSRCPE